MSRVLKSLGLLLLLMAAQQGAVVHELSHFSGVSGTELRVQSNSAVDASCAQCPAFAQVVTPAFSHSFHIPLLVRVDAGRSPEPRVSAFDTAVPQPRSRGPPSSS
jgi:hypothetical protein